MKKLLVTIVASLFVISPSYGHEPEFNDALHASTDNDYDAEFVTDNDGPLEDSEFLSPVLSPRKFHSFEEVFATLSPLLEEKFDTFIVANTSTVGSESDLVPRQHLRVFHKKDSALKVFLRDSSGKITGIVSDNLMSLPGIPSLVPISSGVPGPSSIRTFSGVFRLSVEQTKAKLATSPEAPMSYSSYIDYVYTGGRVSGVAVHGTPTRNHKYLGVNRASHGCLRTFPAFAKALRTHLLSAAMQSNDLPKFDVREALPSPEVQSGKLGSRPGAKVLFIIFNGYHNQSTDI